MRSRRPSAEHQEAVARRLALLGAELAAARAGQPTDGPDSGADSGAVSGPDSGSDSGPDLWWEGHTRVRGARLLPPVADPVPDFLSGPAADPVADPAPGPVPEPGRHAARRRGRPLGEVVPAATVPSTLRGRVALGAPQVAVLAVLVALGLAVTCWWVVRGAASGTDVAPVAAPVAGAPLVPAPGAVATPATGATAAPGTPATTAESEGAGQVTVHVAGKVRRPGIAVLPEGSRVVDALEAAGGARPGVDLSALNLARVLVDGEQVLVGLAPAPGAAPPAAGSSSASSAGSGGATSTTALVNLNTAGLAELESLPEVGPVTAQAIVAWRDEHGGFTTVDELLEVDGIGEATLATIAPHVTV